MEGSGQAHNAGHILRPGPLPALLGAPLDEGEQGNPLADVQGAHPFGPVELVGRQGEHVDLLRPHVDGQVPGSLDGIGVEGDLPGPADRPDLPDGLDGADLIVGVHDGDQTGVLGDGRLHLLGGDAAVCVDVQQGHGEALLLQFLEGVQDGVVLKGGGDDMGFPLPFSPAGGGEDGLVVRFAAAGGKDNLFRAAVETAGHGLPGLGQGGGRRLPQGI